MFSGNSESAKAVIAAMNKTVVASLFCDGPPRGEEYEALREEMTGSSTAPIYVIVDPFTMKKLGQWDYFDAIADNFGERLEKSLRRFDRLQSRRGQVAER